MTDDQIAEILKLELIEMRGEDAFVDNIDIADLRRLVAEAQRIEREECAKLLNKIEAPKRCIAAIRERGNDV